MRKGRNDRPYDAFFLDLRGTIPWEKIPNRGVFAVDEFAPTWMSHRFLTARGISELRETLELYASKGMLPDPSLVYVLTATREEDLPNLARERILHNVLFGIKALKARGDEGALKEVRRALDRRGKKPGVVPKAENKRWLIELLAKLAAEPGRSFKELVPRPWKPASANARLSTFCWGFYLDCVFLGAETSEAWSDPRNADLLRQWHGFDFSDAERRDHDVLAAKEAYRRGKAQVPRTTTPTLV